MMVLQWMYVKIWNNYVSVTHYIHYFCNLQYATFSSSLKTRNYGF